MYGHIIIIANGRSAEIVVQSVPSTCNEFEGTCKYILVYECDCSFVKVMKVYNMSLNFKFQFAFSCVDINECNTGQYSCEEVCANNIGSYECACTPGNVLQADGLSCES